MAFYSKTVFDHFRNPRNVRSMEHPDGVGRAVNEACSDVVTIYIRVKADVIEDVSFKAQGCVACIAAASVTTELVQGKSLEDALLFDKDRILDVLGELPPVKVQCSMISPTALHEAIHDYRNK
jgi:nitrogen fixation NifU-like protein